MLLTDTEIMSLCLTQDVIKPYSDNHVQPASYELHWDGSHQWMDIGQAPRYVSTWKTPEDLYHNSSQIDEDDVLVLSPGDFVLVSSSEYISMPNNYAARVEGKSSLGRLGLAVHTTAGWIDPGFCGNVTLELKNLGPARLLLKPQQKIAQLAFFKMSSPVALPYGHEALGSAYQGQVGVTGSRGTRD